MLALLLACAAPTHDTATPPYETAQVQTADLTGCAYGEPVELQVGAGPWQVLECRDDLGYAYCVPTELEVRWYVDLQLLALECRRTASEWQRVSWVER
jgi:hypothetical protein